MTRTQQVTNVASPNSRPAIAVHLGLPAEDVDGIGVAATIHDIGKLAIPAEILARPGPLTDAERRLVECHAQSGADILARVPLPWPVADMIAQHHERIDGSGYPRGLSGNDILLGARIIAVADTVEAVASHRPYRSGLGIDRALEIIIEGRGKIYDPDPVDACVTLIRDEGFQIETDAANTDRGPTHQRPGRSPATVDQATDGALP